MTRCTDTPVSWLQLELYHLEELAAQQAAKVDRHLSTCAVCRQYLAFIEKDHCTLPSIEVTRRFSLIDFIRSKRGQLTVLATASAVAILAVLVVPETLEQRGADPSAREIVSKGGEPGLTVISQRPIGTVENPDSFLPGDVFSLLATVPGRGEVQWDVVVFQGGEVYFPLTNTEPVRTGNRVPLPGAFRLTGDSPATVCLLIGEEIPGRDLIADAGMAALSSDAKCQVLQPIATNE